MSKPVDLEGENSVRTFELEESEESLHQICSGQCDTAWEACADRLVSSSGWHDQWPMAVANYRKLKSKSED
jgi:hypothetical protein